MFNQPYTPDKMQALEDINATIDLLYITQCRATKNALLNRLRRLLAQLTTVPYSNSNYNTIPVDRTLELPGPAAEMGMTQGVEPGMQQMGAPQTGMPQTGMPQQPQRMMENIPPYIPHTTQPRTETPPGRMQPGMPGPSGGGGMQPPPAQQPKPQAQNLKTFTIDEISKYDGKGNNPAYVAVNGMVYDVTDQPGWAAGSHFGLKAGLDQTGAYISCHTGQPMIDRLKLIGRLVK